MMRSIRKCRKLIPLFLLILMIFTSCTDGGAGIFYSIEIEEEIKNRSLPDYLTAFSYARINDMYYLAGGGLYTWDSLNPSQEWSDQSLPSGWKYTWQVAADDVSDTLYVILENSDGDRSALYTWDGSWSPSAFPLPEGRPYRLWYADGRVYVATQETANETDKIYNYRLYAAPPDLSSFTPIDDGGTTYIFENKPIRDLASNGTTVFFITSDNVYSGSTVGSTFSAETSPSGRYLRKLHYSPLLSSLFLSAGSQSINGSGYVYKWNGVDDWDFVDSVGDDPNDFEDVTFGGSDYLLIGTENGYYESSDGNSFTGESATIESASKYEITDLSSAVVQGLFDGPGNIFFAMTSGNGLWRNTAGTWSRE